MSQLTHIVIVHIPHVTINTPCLCTHPAGHMWHTLMAQSAT